MNFPIKEIWCINRTEDNKFQSYKSQGSRLFIICSWNRSTQDPLKFVLALIHKDKVGKLYYWDMNDLPLYPDEKKNQYEGSLGDDATFTLYQIANNKELNCNRNMNKKLIRLTESDLHKIIKESVKRALNEGSDTVSELQQAYDILKKVTESGYIPFASPFPSGTELEIQRSIVEAMRLISKACYLDTQCYGHEPIANVV